MKEIIHLVRGRAFIQATQWRLMKVDSVIVNHSKLGILCDLMILDSTAPASPGKLVPTCSESI